MRDEERKLDRQIADDARGTAMVYTDKMTGEYEKHDFGKGSLRYRIYMTTSGVVVLSARAGRVTRSARSRGSCRRESTFTPRVIA